MRNKQIRLQQCNTLTQHLEIKIFAGRGKTRNQNEIDKKTQQQNFNRIMCELFDVP